MAASPFKNFNPEDLSARVPIAGSHAVTALLHSAAFACNGNSAPVSNATIAGVIEHVTRYAATTKPRRVSFGDFVYSEYPEYLNLDGITRLQYNAARALLLIDETLGMVDVHGPSADNTDRLLLASAWVNDAASQTANDDKWHSIVTEEKKRMEVENKRIQAEARAKEVEASREEYAKDSVEKAKPAVISATHAQSAKRARDARTKKRAKLNENALTVYKSGAPWAKGDAAAITIHENLKIPLGTARNMITQWRDDGLIG